MKYGDLVRRKREFYNAGVRYPGGFAAVGIITSRGTNNLGAPLRCFVKLTLDNKIKTLTVRRDRWEVISEGR